MQTSQADVPIFMFDVEGKFVCKTMGEVRRRAHARQRGRLDVLTRTTQLLPMAFKSEKLPDDGRYS